MYICILGESQDLGPALTGVLEVCFCSDCSLKLKYFVVGTQESIYSCFRIADNVSVHANYCQGQVMPELYTRTCNDQPCPPRLVDNLMTIFF